MRVKSPVETDHQRRLRLLHDLQAVTNTAGIKINRLFTEHRLAGTGEQFYLLRMKVCRCAQNDGIDVSSRHDILDTANVGTVLIRDQPGGRGDRVVNGGQRGAVITGNGAGMNLADAAGTKNGETKGHAGTPV